jgi:hypothetical protein
MVLSGKLVENGRVEDNDPVELVPGWCRGANLIT